MKKIFTFLFLCTAVLCFSNTNKETETEIMARYIQEYEKIMEDYYELLLEYEEKVNYAELSVKISGAIEELHNHKNLPIGTVIASVLSPEQFEELLGEKIIDDKNNAIPTATWVLADGSNVYGSKYADLTKEIINVPNLLGTFLRGMNHSGNGNDPDKNRTVGDLQRSQVEGHIHSYSRVTDIYGKNYNNAGSGWKNVPASGEALRHSGEGGDGSNPYSIGIKNSIDTTVPMGNGNIETRPINVSVYYYIKIN